MARIENYGEDTELTGVEKLLLSDNGTVKTTILNNIQTFLGGSFYSKTETNDLLTPKLDITVANLSYEAKNENIQAHVIANNNPHNVTASQVGAYSKNEADLLLDGKIDEIYLMSELSQANKLITQADLLLSSSGDMKKSTYDTDNSGTVDKADKLTAPVNINGVSFDGSADITITKNDIGLGNVDDTSDIDKPISTATQTLLDTKVDKVTGKELSTNDFTDVLKTLLELKKVKNVTTDAVNDRLVITYTDGTSANLNLADIINDIYVSGASLNATTNVLTLTSTNGGADVTVNLSDFVNSTEFTDGLDGKVDKVTGKELSANDFTDVLKTKLDGIAENANNYTHPASHSIAEITDLSNQLGAKVAKITSTDNAIVRFDGITGTVQDSTVTIDDDGGIFSNIAPLSTQNKTIADIDLNTSIQAGSFVGTVVSNYPAGNAGEFYYVTNIVHNASWIFQQVTRMSNFSSSGDGGIGVTYQRMYTQAIWGSWVQVVQTNSAGRLILGGTDDGVNKLQVNGSLKANGSINSNGQQYGTWVESMQTSDGGLQNVRVVEDCFGRWLVVGKFAADASVSVGGLISTVRGLSTSLEQSDATNFSADFGNSYPTEVRFMGATDFTKWKETRTIDWVYKVPANKLWKDFFVGVNNVRWGFNVAGAYDGFGRWNNPNMNFMKMSDNGYINPADAYINPAANAINFNTGGDPKFIVIHNAAAGGQDDNATSSFGYDDGWNNFFDVYPSVYSNHSGTKMYTSAVWLMIKLN